MSASRTVKTVARKGPAVEEVYADLLEEIWRDVQPLIGAVSLYALVGSAVRNAADKHPWVSSIQISVEGIQRDSVLEALSGAAARDVRNGMGELVKNLVSLFESVAGSIIVKQVLPKVMKAERQLASREAKKS